MMLIYYNTNDNMNNLCLNSFTPFLLYYNMFIENKIINFVETLHNYSDPREN